MTTIKRLQRKRSALSTVHRLLESEESMIARQLAECRSKQQQEQAKLSSLQSYYAEYLEAMRNAQNASTAKVQARVSQQHFLGRLQTVMERQQGELQALNEHTARAVQIWTSASRRAKNMKEQLNKVDRQLARARTLSFERQAEEEDQQRRLFLSR